MCVASFIYGAVQCFFRIIVALRGKLVVVFQSWNWIEVMLRNNIYPESRNLSTYRLYIQHYAHVK
jgi:hypothetical protein